MIAIKNFFQDAFRSLFRENFFAESNPFNITSAIANFN